MKIVDELKQAWKSSTITNNLFQKCVESIKWERVYDWDGEVCYINYECALIVKNLNPFDKNNHPCIIAKGKWYEV